MKRRSSSENRPNMQNVCILCDSPAGTHGLHRASTFDIDFKVQKYATKLNDTCLLSKLSAGDIVAIDA